VLCFDRYLKLNPKYEVSNEECVSLRLELSQSSVKLDTIFEASFKFMIYDQLIGKHKVHLGKVANYIFPLFTLSDKTCSNNEQQTHT
jgi:hypothetical protein